jgi:hypothetical protein
MMHRRLPGLDCNNNDDEPINAARYSLADPGRERYLAEVSIDPARYVGSLPQFFERETGINRAVLV